MDTRSIIIPLDEVWEIVNKPHRLMRYMRDEVEKIAPYEGFSEETKKEVIERLGHVAESGVLHNNGISRELYFLQCLYDAGIEHTREFALGVEYFNTNH